MPLATYTRNADTLRWEVYYGQKLIQNDLSIREATLVTEALNKVQLIVTAGTLWDTEKVQKIGLKNRFVITDEQAVKIISYMTNWQVQNPEITLDEYQVARSIRYWFISKTEQQMRQTWVYFQNQQLEDRHIINPMFDWPAMTPVEVFLTWFGAEYGMDVIKLMEGKTFAESKLEYEAD